ncbi:MAG: ABC transporter permease [Candidatus Nanopelagicaceae bacterium]
MSKPVEVYEPFRAGLPPLGRYWRSLWARRSFINEYARSELHASHFDSIFGQLWLILNPLLLSAIYFVLIKIIAGSADSLRYAHLTSSLFLFYLVSNAMNSGTKSVTSSENLILNTAFPRIALPLSTTIVALFKFLPTIPVFLIIKLVLGLPFDWKMLWGVVVIFVALVFGLGVAILIAAANVYVRDISNFLPYLNRTLLYVSPVLFEASSVSDKLAFLKNINPFFPILDTWSKVMVHNESLAWGEVGKAAIWAFSTLLIGTYLFLSREREFAVRV